MFCRGRALFWVDGKILERRKDYTNFGPRWRYAKSYTPCKAGHKWAGVTLRSGKGAGYAGKELRWFVIAPAHHVTHSIIEFPMGARKSKPSASNQSQ